MTAFVREVLTSTALVCMRRDELVERCEMMGIETSDEDTGDQLRDRIMAALAAEGDLLDCEEP